MNRTADLFAEPADPLPPRQELGPGALLLRGFAVAEAADLLAALAGLLVQAPFRQMTTPGGFRMSVGMSNCGALGWISERRGYRYAAVDPDSGRPWPAMPSVFARLSARAARAAGFADFLADACLINRYAPGARLTLHQDRNERDFAQPVVTVSLGLPARFQFGGLERAERPRVVALVHGDVVVWGGPARLYHHGVLPLKDGVHPATGACRISLTFRRAA